MTVTVRRVEPGDEVELTAMVHELAEFGTPRTGSHPVVYARARMCHHRPAAG